MIENTGRKIGGGGITGRHNLGAYIYTAWESVRFASERSTVRSRSGPPNPHGNYLPWGFLRLIGSYFSSHTGKTYRCLPQKLRIIRDFVDVSQRATIAD